MSVIDIVVLVFEACLCVFSCVIVARLEDKRPTASINPATEQDKK